MIIHYLKDGMDRIEFRNQLLELIIGNNSKGDEVKLKDFKLNDIIVYLKEQITEMEQESICEG